MKHVRPAVIFFEVCPPLSVAAGFRPSEPAELLLADAYRLFRFNHTGKLIATAPDAAINDVVENWLAVDTLRESSHVPGQRWRL